MPGTPWSFCIKCLQSTGAYNAELSYPGCALWWCVIVVLRNKMERPRYEMGRYARYLDRVLVRERDYPALRIIEYPVGAATTIRIRRLYCNPI